MNSTSCKYYTERTLGWMLNNKMIVFLSLLSFCLFVSTLALAGQKNRLEDEVEFLKTSTVEPTTPAPATTPVPATTLTPTEPPSSVANTEESVVDTTTVTTDPEETGSTTIETDAKGVSTQEESEGKIRNSRLISLLSDVAKSGVSV